MVARADDTPPDRDPMGPPKVPVEVECIHCGNVYMSDQIRWQPDPDGPDGGWWVCPIDGCDGAGFCFDIYPTDPEVAKQFGVEMHFADDDEDEDFYNDDDDNEELTDPLNDSSANPFFTPESDESGEDDKGDIPF